MYATLTSLFCPTEDMGIVPFLDHGIEGLENDGRRVRRPSTTRFYKNLT